jgi:hypothetical protein
LNLSVLERKWDDTSKEKFNTKIHTNKFGGEKKNELQTGAHISYLINNLPGRKVLTKGLP